MATISDLLAKKSSQVLTIGPEASVLDAALVMNEHKIGSLVVLAGGRVVGIISERDVLTRVVVARRDPGQAAVSDVMTKEVVCARFHTTIQEARGVMKNRRIRHLPVVDDQDQLAGLISIGDLNAHEAHAQETTIHILEQYIYGRV